MATILVIGGADTGRAPMAAALLRRLLEARGYDWPVGSAGVLGHDGDVAEIEARDTMAHMGSDISQHRARSLTDDLVAEAALLLALDAGTALAVRARFPGAASRTHTLGALAGRPRDIPDPFRMQIGAWITYAREIETLLEAALPRIIEALPLPTTAGGEAGGWGLAAGVAAPVSSLQSPLSSPEEQTPSDAALVTHGPSLVARTAAVERIERLLRVAAEMPDVLDWGAARARIEADLGQAAAAPIDAGDLVAAYVGLLRAALVMTPAAPSSGQLSALRDAVSRLGGVVYQADLNDLSARLGGWVSL